MYHKKPGDMFVLMLCEIRFSKNFLNQFSNLYNLLKKWDKSIMIFPRVFVERQLDLAGFCYKRVNSELEL